ncbi:glycosyltransferase-like protein (PssD) [Parvularcula bermudensis HTCC2503]|uniref:Glycosyltransferase-like protein (PssD) n=1 Tax=Parvularcula bermudensis (strain ATCC BAA-594 / HTCC2503 / KCTC 12087) TaxID=314260 RepID=E0TI99_PARBH|nr:glucuronosyltransferase [Parvularcula bermudensis]ADM09438.1 glycosyltransferase-like protein (PssD) [Parvularcula bermudensis HTCC2503]
MTKAGVTSFRRVMAIASGGGHWHQLMMMRDAYGDQHVDYVTTLPGLAEQYDATPVTIVPDCNRNEKLKIVQCTLALLGLLLRKRPEVIITTGALPGVIALAIGKTLGKKTIWVDSVANAEEMSMSGRLARRFADHWMSQWEHVAAAEGADFAGRVL